MRLNIKLLALLVGMVLSSCSKFLDEKSDKKLAVPTTMQDLEALLGYTSDMNLAYCSIIGEVASDNFFLMDNMWLGLNRNEDRAIYVWDRTPVLGAYWVGPYKRILNTNIVLSNLDKIEGADELKNNRVKGMALFYRAYSFFDLLQIYSTSFDRNTASDNPGIVLRLSGNLEEDLTRNSLLECMVQVEQDLLSAESFLKGWMPNYPTQPSIAAVYALLSKYYLMTKEYDKSLYYAESCMKVKGELMDYNLVTGGKYPFEKYNKEVLFYVQGSGQTMVQEANALVNPDLYNMYDETDRRKALFFTRKSDGNYLFTGDYGKGASSQKFCGLTTAEVMLTKAECNIRLEKKEEAIADMLYFLKHRYTTITIPMVGMDNAELLSFVLNERRKELIMRGVRWFDLKRLSREESGVEKITRVIKDRIYSISLNDLKMFRFAVPQSVLDATELEP